MKFLGSDKDGAPRFYWCCETARNCKAIGFLNDGKRKYDSDRTGFYITETCGGPGSTKNGNHPIHKILFCPFCSAPVEN